jgi:hypothetical protein
MCEMLFHFFGLCVQSFVLLKVLIYSENLVFKTSIQVEKCGIYFYFMFIDLGFKNFLKSYTQRPWEKVQKGDLKGRDQ